MQYDVAIVGGGPAGAAAAIVLARGGVRVALLERTGYDSWRVGEHLPPYAGFVLAELGAWPRFQRDGHLPCPGRVTLWGSEHPGTEDYLFHPLGHGWLLDRCQFDASLAEIAEAYGAAVMRRSAVIQVDRNSDCWQLRARRADGNKQEASEVVISARFLIVATGRSRLPLLRDLGRRTLLDRQVAHVGVYQLGPAVGEEGRDDSGDAKRDARLHIEAEEGGWWYGCRLPHDRAVTALLSDADLLPNLGNRNSHTLALRRKHTRLLRDMIPDAAPVFHFARLSACSYLCEPIFGEASLLLGDASQSVDPLAGQGITRALWTGMNGGKAVLAHLEGNAQAIRAYAAQLKDGTEIYLRERQQTYRREQRWPCAAYWQRR